MNPAEAAQHVQDWHGIHPDLDAQAARALAAGGAQVVELCRGEQAADPRVAHFAGQVADVLYGRTR